MGEALLAGGPRDGKRIAVADGTGTVTVAYVKRTPFPLPPEPRPPWWRHPIRWFRWKPPPPPPMPEVTQLAYRDTGKISGGARVFEIDGDWPWFRGPEAAGADYRDLVTAYGVVHPMIRQDQGTRWVMSPDWYMRIRAIGGNERSDPDHDDPAKWEPDPRDCLLGVPITVTGDGGAAHIENRRYPADF
jgi:hypothetical protein